MNLSKRLLALASFIDIGDRLADIGTDHGYLPIFLANRGNNYIVAADLNKGPYETALKNVQKVGLSAKIDVRLGDGLSVLKPGEVGTAIIAGMGGATIVDILSGQPLIVQGLKKLVLQPMTDEDILRKWLMTNGWVIDDEELVQEDDKIYTVIMARKGAGFRLKEEEILYGPVLLARKHPLLKEKLEKELEHRKRIMAQIKRQGSIQAREQSEKMSAEIKRLEEVLECLLNAKPL